MAGLTGSGVELDAEDARLRGHLAVPASGHGPGLVLVPDVRGLSDHYRDVAGRFAGAGFLTLAIDLYSREGAPALPDMDAVMRWMAALPDARVLGDLAAAARYVAARPERRGGIGITGFCMGGQYAFMAACSDATLGACVSWYGMLRYAAPSPHRPRSPLDLAPNLQCPYLGFFGEDDALIPEADVGELRAVLARGTQPHEIRTYPRCGHAFFNDTRPDAYRPEAAKETFERGVTFLESYLT